LRVGRHVEGAIMGAKRDLSAYVATDATAEEIDAQWTAIETRLARRRRSALLPASLALLGATVAAIIIYLSMKRFSPQRHFTSGTAPLRFMLADGAGLQLQPASDVVLLGQREDEARLEIVRGEARFDLRRSPARRFQVTAASVDLVATGTVFTVILEDDLPHVSVERGEVEVRQRQQGHLLARLRDGEWWPALGLPAAIPTKSALPSARTSSPAQ
jgi:ferric-dicitrate binding protein FerR (iron transport regulator)